MCKLKIYFFIIVIFSIFIIPKFSQAQVSLSILPEKFDLKLERGQVFTSQVRISNLGQENLEVKVHLTDFGVNSNSGEMVFEEGAASYQTSQWISFSANNFFLSPSQTQEMNFEIKVPDNAEPGGHYAVALFQADSPVMANKNVKVSTSVGLLFLLTVEGDLKFPALNQQIELTKINLPKFIEYGPLSFSFFLKNNDPIHVPVGGSAIIYNIFGQPRAKIEIAAKNVFSNSVREFKVETSAKNITDRFFIGPYRLKLSLASQTWQDKIGNDQQLVSEFIFFAFPWKVIFISFILIMVLIVFITRFIKKTKNHQTNIFNNQ